MPTTRTRTPRRPPSRRPRPRPRPTTTTRTTRRRRDPDDVEEDLDQILRDRIAAAPDEEDEDEEAAVDTEDRTEAAGRVPARAPGEFVCQSCFLVKHPSQLADGKAMLCADCV